MHSFFFVSLFLLTANAVTDVKNASIAYFPFTAVLETLDDFARCSGVIISDHWIVTTNKCLTEGLKVRTGVNRPGEGGTTHFIDRVVLHEKFQDEYHDKLAENGIALLHFKEPFEFDVTRQKIELFEPYEKLTSGTIVTSSGFGLTAADSDDYPESLRSVRVPIMDNHECNEFYDYVGGVPDGYVCASYKDVDVKNSCQRYKGGAMTVNGRLAGVAAWSGSCGYSWNASYPVVFLDISYYHDWIYQYIEQ